MCSSVQIYESDLVHHYAIEHNYCYHCKKVFGRKFSLSLDNFNSLTLGERKENSPENYSTESFKKTNVRSYMNHEHKL